MLETVSLEGMLIYSQQNMLQNMFKTFLLAKPQSLVKKRGHLQIIMGLTSRRTFTCDLHINAY